MNAIDMLKDDHRRTRDLIQRLLTTRAEQIDLRHQLFELLSQELEIHARLEEELFYPVMDRQGLHEQDEVADDLGEHQWMREALSSLEHVDPSNPAWLGKVGELADCFEHHVREEETDLFVSADEKIAGELEAIGSRMEQEKADLLRNY